MDNTKEEEEEKIKKDNSVINWNKRWKNLVYQLNVNNISENHLFKITI